MSPIDPTAIPLSCYVHWPWCVRKCPYCDFNSRRAPVNLASEAEDRYVDALLSDLEYWIEPAGGRALASVFFGGGTPSLMSTASMARLMEGIERCFELLPDAEITMEANPGTMDEEKFEGFRKAGINRISIGVQSLSDERLAKLGRIHTAADARRAVKAAVEIFENVNLDLMYALPGETFADLEREIDEAVALGTTHFSCYQLTIEDGTAFAKHLPEALPDEDLTADMGERVHAMLAENGFEHYEVSGYARPGRRCRHNLNYWNYGDYLAVGAGAHAKLTLADGRIVREARFASPARYLKAVEVSGQGVEYVETVEDEEKPFEFMLNALRLLEGVPSAYFEARTGLSLASIDPVLKELRAKGLLENDPERIRTTPLGMRFLSEVQEAFLEPFPEGIGR